MLGLEHFDWLEKFEQPMGMLQNDRAMALSSLSDVVSLRRLISCAVADSLHQTIHCV